MSSLLCVVYRVKAPSIPDAWVGTGMKQLLADVGVAMQGGLAQRGVVGVVRCVYIGSGLQQDSHDLRVACSGSLFKRCLSLEQASV